MQNFIVEAMPFEVHVIRAREFVQIGTQGAFDFENTCAALVALAQACRKRGVDRALIDVRGAISNLTPDDLASLVHAFSEAAHSKALRLAIVHTGDQNYRARLFAFFSSMRGRKVRAFQNYDEGVDWLSEDDDAGQGSAVEIPVRKTESGEDPENPAIPLA